MSEIKRYSEVIRNCEYEGMHQSPNGQWVRWEDVEKLLKRLEKLEHDEEIRNMYTTVMGRPL
jgi:hypothetical protein